MLGFGSIASGSIADSVIVAGGPVTINISLSSVTSTGSMGALSVPVMVSISGVTGTDTVGTIAKTIGVGATGVSDTATVTSVTALAVSATVVTISGVSSTSTIVTVPVTIGVGTTPVTDTGSVGTVDKTIAVGITAVSDTGSLTNILPSAASLTNITISGVSDTGTTVSVVPSQASGVSLTPVSDTGSVGTGVVNQSIGLTLVGNMLTGSVNATVPSASSSGSVSITGVSGTDTINNVLASQLVGANVTTVTGTDTVNNITGLTSNNVALTGVSDIGTIGSDIPTINIALSGTNSTGGVNGLSLAFNLGLVGTSSTIFSKRSNFINNSTMQGAVVGIIGSGGVIPTGWALGLATGINAQVVGTGILGDGNPYIDIRVYGTNNTAGIAYPDIYPMIIGSSQLFVMPGTTVTGSILVDIIAGSRIGFITSSLRISVGGWAANGAYVESGTGILVAGTRGSYTRVLVGTATVKSSIYIDNSINAGASADVTYRISAPQLELGSTATAYIPTYGTISSEPLSPTLKLGVAGVSSATFSKRTNLTPNSTLQGAVVGVIGSGGVAPSSWIFNNVTGISREIVAVGTLGDGNSYIDYRVFGTNPSGLPVYPDVYLQPGAYTPASIGQAYTFSIYLQDVGGSRTGFISSITAFGVAEMSIIGQYLIATIGGATSGSRSVNTKTFSNANVARVSGLISFAISANATVDFTVRISAPQLEVGPVATAYIPTYGIPASETLPIEFTLSSSGVIDTASTGSIATVPLAAATVTGTANTASLGTLAPSQSTGVSLTGTTSTGSVVTLSTSGASTASVSISGNTITGTNNNLTTAQTVQATLTGVSTSGSIGSDTPSQSSVILISGTTDTATVNNVTASQVVAIAITGTSDVATVGSATPAGVSNVNVSVSGVSSTDTVNSVSVSSVSVGGVLLTGINSNETVGTIGTGQSIGISLSGNTATLAVTGIVGNPAYSVTLVGVSDTATIGSDKPTIGISLNGNSGTATASSLNTTQLVGTSITGTSSGFTVGSILPGLGINVSGTLASPILGILNKSISIGLAGNLITGAMGQIAGGILRNVNISGVYGIPSVNGVSVSASNIDFGSIYKTSAVTFITDIDQQVVVNLSDDVSVVPSSANFDSIYKSSTVTFITVVDDYLVITLDNTYNVVLQLTEDNFIQQAESTGVVSNV